MAQQDQANLPEPPWNPDAEESILGSCLLTPGSATTITKAQEAGLQPGDFYRASHRRIWLAMVDLHAHGNAVDAITVADRLAELGTLQDAGGVTRIHELATLVPTASNIATWVEIVVQESRRRDALRVSDVLREQALASTDPDKLEQTAYNLLDELTARGGGADAMQLETWHEFESQAHDQIPVLIDKLWPEAAFGFIAAPPKKGKTWVGLAISIAVAAGKPLFGHYTVPKPRPVVYVALEGHRAALRARIGAIARGMGINPDGDQLDNLHFLYKPRGINLADITWANHLRRTAANVDAALLVVDVLRAAARINENAQEDFSNLRANLQPITDDGRSLAMLHHNVKLSEISKERDPGERMSGSGSMYGALDTGIYITGSEDHARKLRIDFDLRDLATPNHINVHLTGEGTGENGGFTYRDTATFQIVEDETPEDGSESSAQAIYEWIVDQGGDVLSTDIRSYFDISSDTLTRRVGRLLQLGVEYTGGRGRAGRFTIVEPTAQLDIDASEVAATPEMPHAATTDNAATEPHNHAGSGEVAASNRTEDVRQLETPDLQGKEEAAVPAPYGSAPAPAGAHTPARARAHTREGDKTTENGNGTSSRKQAELWIRNEGWRHTEPIQGLIEQWPALGTNDLAELTTLAADLLAAELEAATE